MAASTQEKICYYGEHFCSAVVAKGPCRNRAYFALPDGALVCGVHGKGKSGSVLPSNPEAPRLAREAEGRQAASIEAAREANRAAGRPGVVALAPLSMFRKPEVLPGFLAVFPNHKAGSAVTATRFCARELSPMVLGPVEHGQPGLPPAQLLESYWQANKAFFSEVGKDGNPLPVWYERRKELYASTTPRRHKLGASKAEHLKNSGIGAGNPNAALYSIFVDKDGTERRYSYVDSRRFYCHFYEATAGATAAFAELSRLREAGTNLQIFDPDGCPMASDLPQPELEAFVLREYENAARPFGHGKVLFTMLALPSKQRPWARFFQ